MSRLLAAAFAFVAVATAACASNATAPPTPSPTATAAQPDATAHPINVATSTPANPSPKPRAPVTPPLTSGSPTPTPASEDPDGVASSEDPPPDGPATPTPHPPLPGEPGRYSLTVYFGESVTGDDMNEADAIVTSFDPEAQFMVMEMFPPVGAVTLRSTDPGTCAALLAAFKGKTYVRRVDCHPTA